MEEEDDLKLKPDVFINNVMKTPPIKALEEGDDPPITPSPTSAGPVTRRSTSNPPTNSSCTSNHSNSNHSNPPSIPTAAGTVSGSNGLASSNPSSQWAEDLNEFYRVMEQVCEKESRLSSGTATSILRTSGGPSTQIDMYSSVSPPSLVGAGATGGGGGASSQHVISPPPYNPASSTGVPQGGGPSVTARYGGGGGGGAQQLRTTLTSPPELTTSPPFSTAGATHSLYNPPPTVGGQPAPSATPAQHQAPPYPTTAGPVSMAASQVNMALKFSDPSLHSLSSLPQHSTAFQTTAQQRQQVQTASAKHPKMHLSHLNHHGEVVPHPGMAPAAPLTSPITSHMTYYNNSSQTQPLQAQRQHTSTTSLPPPPQPPLTPTAPLGHFTACFPTAQQNAQSPGAVHRSNSLHHQTSIPATHPHYTYSPETSHFLSNSVQSSYNQSMAVAQRRQMMQQQQQQSAALTISTNSWRGHRQTPQLAYKDSTMMSVHHGNPVLVGRTHHVLQQTTPADPTLTSYPPHLRMGQPLHHHTPGAAAPSPVYLNSNSHPSSVTAFSRLSFPPNMQ